MALKLESETIELQSLSISNVLNFRCTENNNGVVLNWQTIDEENIASFNIQRSADGITFMIIACYHDNNRDSTLPK